MEDIDDSSDHAIAHTATDSPEGGNIFETVVVTDVEGNESSAELRDAALRHFKRGGGYYEMPHEQAACEERYNPELFPKAYPTLFPYGIGGFEDVSRPVWLSMEHHAKHLFNLADRRFQEHYSFMFTVFNILQRRTVMINSSLKVERASYGRVAADLAAVSPESLAQVSQKMQSAAGVSSLRDFSAEERRVLRLMDEVKLVSRDVRGSNAARLHMRNEIRGLMVQLGLPSFYLTINPADVYNPLVKFLAGADINLDDLLPDDVPDIGRQSILIVRNPVVAAKFFNIVIKAFITTVLGYDNKDVDGGILGHVKGYYGCVEAQGRGSLHCHMIIWVEGGLNPNKIRDKVMSEGGGDFGQHLIEFLDDTISTKIPDIPKGSEPMTRLRRPERPPLHPCSIRDIVQSGEEQTLGEDVKRTARTYDLHQLAQRCQRHEHSETCYKYCKSGEPRVCRFDLDPENVCNESFVNYETGDICLRCLDSLVNNFNETILRAVRCNMDIQFIGSGEAAKAIVYYITNYVVKEQLTTHVAYAALELAAKRLRHFDPSEDEITTWAKELLRKCAFRIIANQELSAQQVASYNLGLEDHFTSHCFRNLYWASAERYVHGQDPSPECVVRQRQAELPPDTPDAGEDVCDNEDDASGDEEDAAHDNEV